MLGLHRASYAITSSTGPGTIVASAGQDVLFGQGEAEPVPGEQDVVGQDRTQAALQLAAGV